MRFFTIPDFHHLVLAFFLGLAAALVVYLSFRYGVNRKPPYEGGTIDPTPTLRDADDNPIPPVLVLVYVAVLLFILFYIVLSVLRGAVF